MIKKKSSLNDISGKAQSDTQKNSQDFDIPRKVLIMENTLVKLKESIKATSEIKDLKDSVSMLSEIRARLREMEDLELITKLETIQAQDEILGLTDDMDTLQGKMELLSGAIKMISTKIATPDTKRDATNFEEMISSLKSELDTIKKTLESQDSKNNASDMKDLERKYSSIDTEFRKFVSAIKIDLEKRDNKFKSMLSTQAGTTGKAEIDIINTEIATLKDVVNKVENLVKASGKSAKEFESRITKNNEKTLAQLNEQAKAIDGFRDMDKKLVTVLDSKIMSIKQDIALSIDNKIANMHSVDKELPKTLDSQKPDRAEYMKYVPVLKENVSKLYKVYNKTEKRIADIESHIAENKNDVKDSTIKKAVAAELSDVVENINTMSTDIKSDIKSETLKQKVLMDALRNEFNTKLLSLEADSADMSKVMKKSKSEPQNYEEFAEFKAKVFSDIDELKNNIKKSEKKVSSSEVEDLFDNKLIPHISNQDKITKSVALLNRKLEQRHLEISKNAHENIKTSVNPLAERLSQIESDIVLLKDTRTELIDDVKTIIENFEKKEEKSGANSNDIEKKYDETLKNLTEKIEMIQSGNGMTGEMLERKMRAVQDESEVLRQELEKIKGLYFEMLDRDKNAPVIIE